MTPTPPRNRGHGRPRQQKDRNLPPPLTYPGSRTLKPPDQPGKPKGWWPAPSTPLGAVLYGVIGSLIFWLLVYVLHHVHVYLSWHLALAANGDRSINTKRRRQTDV